MTAGLAVSAEIAQTPNFPMNGNKCGKVIVNSEIDRDVYITITQHTEEGDYDYYKSVIPFNGKEKEYSFKLEGKDDVNYTLQIGVPKYKSASSLQYYEDEFVIFDTDEIEAQNISGYQHKYMVNKGEELSNQKTIENEKNSDNLILNEINVYFPTADYMAGDANSDNVIDIRDAAYIARKVAQRKTSDLPEYSDYNGDNAVDIRDAAAIAKMVAQRKR